MDSVWTEFSDLQSHMGEGLPGPDTCHQKSCCPPQGCPPLRRPAESHPQPSPSGCSRPSAALLILLASLSVSSTSVRGGGHSCFLGGCSRLISGPCAFPPASVHSTLPQEHSVPNTHLTTAPSSPKLLQRQKPDVARGPEVGSGHAEWPPCGLAPLVCAPDTGHPHPSDSPSLLPHSQGRTCTAFFLRAAFPSFTALAQASHWRTSSMKAMLGLSLLVPRMNRRDPHTLPDWTNPASTCFSSASLSKADCRGY